MKQKEFVPGNDASAPDTHRFADVSDRAKRAREAIKAVDKALEKTAPKKAPRPSSCCGCC